MRTPSHSSRARWGTLAVVVTVAVTLDQIAKQLAHAHLRGHGRLTVIDGFFDLRYARNPGAFFSLGAEVEPTLRRVLFVGASIFACALITRLYARASARQWALRWALLALLAGAVGNLVDRVLYGEVIDFVHLYWRGVFDWATFNLADVFIVVGLALLGVDLVHGERRRTPEPEERAGEGPPAEAPPPEDPDHHRRKAEMA